MYHQGKRLRHLRWYYALAGGLLLAAAVIWVVMRLLPSTAAPGEARISNAPAVVSYADAPPPGKVFDQGLFSITLPADWKLATHLDYPYRLYHYVNTSAPAGIRSLDVYADALPLSLPVNRIVPVQAQGDRMTHEVVSDNCTGFAAPTAVSGASFAPAKWHDVAFYCDIGNYQRDVVGTGAAGGINQVVLSSPTQGTHRFFITYTDDSNQPDYSIFYRALDSFRLH